MINLQPLEQLRIADPDTYVWVKGRVILISPPPSEAWLERLVDETVWALSQEQGLGRAVADGLLRLMIFADVDRSPAYIRMVRQAAQTGPTLARLLAVHLVPVLMADASLLEHFTATVAVMRSKGTYTLSEPLEVLSELLQGGDRASADAYLDLLAATFSQELTYNFSVRLVYLLPKAVRGLVPRRRRTQIEALIRVVRTQIQLVDAFLEGMQKGLALLGPDDLKMFMDQALLRLDRAFDAGAAFISLSSEEGRRACTNLQVAVPLIQVKGSLERYLNARLGRALAVQPISALPLSSAETVWICSDGSCIYLNDELDHFPVRDKNRLLAKHLVRLEAGCFEYGTFTLDLERAGDRFPEVAHRTSGRMAAAGEDRCEAERFFACFDVPELAEDLFNIFEQGRLVRRMAHDYPGLIHQALPVLRDEIGALRKNGCWDHPLAPLYSRLAAGEEHPASAGWDRTEALTVESANLFDSVIIAKRPVEICAQMVCLTYDAYASLPGVSVRGYRRLIPPFGRRLRWDLVRSAWSGQTGLTSRIKLHLAERGLKIYRGELQQKLSEQNGRISPDDIKTLIVSAAPQAGAASGVPVNWSDNDLSALFKAAGIDSGAVRENDGTAFYYPEWDDGLRGYLRDHVRVQESVVPAGDDSDFYRSTLDRYHGLVLRIRRAFEFLKPEGLVMLRQWPEGDDFDYRALIDFVIDRRAGRIPSDRLFVKRLKQERDVAALLLVDLSRSTANPVIGGQETVLKVAKEALVLFCEALQVVGDTFAIAGFSGTGRHSVDYFRVKDFEQPLTAVVQQRISVLRPQRSTRMGAAIRHALSQLAAVPSQVRLLIVVTDGFPNDLGYKADYAIADTRRAVQEARARNVHVKAITVNIGSDPRLDDLYGRVHHYVIADVRDLPDKLLRMYGLLTKRL
jgi:nitric oxide reductase NorD protein